ncbi:MAG: hypothetical protein LLF86_00390 [Nitrospiraceae bacterium]|nr:hypothetical protein [Nitrospiraceae bacterium]
MPGGMWDSDKYDIKALVEKNGKTIKETGLKYSGKNSMHAAQIELKQAGQYSLTIYAFDPSNGNTGVSKTSFKLE